MNLGYLHGTFDIADQRNLGMSMRIERSSLDQVKKRFEMNKKKQEEKAKEYDFEERMKELREEVRNGSRKLLTHTCTLQHLEVNETAGDENSSGA